jgi:hypothetical protein
LKSCSLTEKLYARGPAGLDAALYRIDKEECSLASRTVLYDKLTVILARQLLNMSLYVRGGQGNCRMGQYNRCSFITNNGVYSLLQYLIIMPV